MFFFNLIIIIIICKHSLETVSYRLNMSILHGNIDQTLMNSLHRLSNCANFRCIRLSCYYNRV